ncbi:MAG: NAD(+)/NADH kinase [Pseudomonadales bacterium]|nr:NAD(+)/NADH kinase [Pseudomonadales bacterium]MCP5184837.1 NAD(+)/NADH kinase [Pseudomonadales bacterium]
MVKVGLIVNPVAGVGGPVALKGSDGVGIVAEAFRRGAVPRAGERVAQMLSGLSAETLAQVAWYAAAGAMGGALLADAGVDWQCVDRPQATTSAEDTRRLARALLTAGVSVLVFAGGDGTARDIAAVVGTQVTVVGIPAGVKMHSGVFATSPRNAAELLNGLASGQLMEAVDAEVRDVDEAAARRGEASSRWYAEMRIPRAGGFVQQTKIGGREDAGLAREEIVQGVLAILEANPGRPLALGAGGTLLALKERLGIVGTLLGVDVRGADGAWRLDVTAADLLALDSRPLVVVSFGAAQGFLFGRGNQQFSPAFLRRLVLPDDLLILATRAKLHGLDGRPLRVDTGDVALDAQLAGVREVLCGYDDRLLYRVEAA